MISSCNLYKGHIIVYKTFVKFIVQLFDNYDGMQI